VKSERVHRTVVTTYSGPHGHAMTRQHVYSICGAQIHSPSQSYTCTIVWMSEADNGTPAKCTAVVNIIPHCSASWTGSIISIHLPYHPRRALRVGGLLGRQLKLLCVGAGAHERRAERRGRVSDVPKSRRCTPEFQDHDCLLMVYFLLFGD
jgi:hypothetical protein